jgi:general secretion pathway protein D
LIKSKKLTTVEKVPVLGNIPLIGNLFKKTGHQIEKTNLLVFITPRVVRSVEEERELTKGKVEMYYENIEKMTRSRRGITSDIKGFGEFRMEEELKLNVE